MNVIRGFGVTLLTMFVCSCVISAICHETVAELVHRIIITFSLGISVLLIIFGKELIK